MNEKKNLALNYTQDMLEVKAENNNEILAVALKEHFFPAASASWLRGEATKRMNVTLTVKELIIKMARDQKMNDLSDTPLYKPGIAEQHRFIPIQVVCANRHNTWQKGKIVLHVQIAGQANPKFNRAYGLAFNIEIPQKMWNNFTYNGNVKSLATSKRDYATGFARVAENGNVEICLDQNMLFSVCPNQTSGLSENVSTFVDYYNTL